MMAGRSGSSAPRRTSSTCGCRRAPTADRPGGGRAAHAATSAKPLRMTVLPARSVVSKRRSRHPPPRADLERDVVSRRPGTMKTGWEAPAKRLRRRNRRRSPARPRPGWHSPACTCRAGSGRENPSSRAARAWWRRRSRASAVAAGHIVRQRAVHAPDRPPRRCLRAGRRTSRSASIDPPGTRQVEYCTQTVCTAASLLGATISSTPALPAGSLARSTRTGAVRAIGRWKWKSCSPCSGAASVARPMVSDQALHDRDMGEDRRRDAPLEMRRFSSSRARANCASRWLLTRNSSVSRSGRRSQGGTAKVLLLVSESFDEVGEPGRGRQAPGQGAIQRLDRPSPSVRRSAAIALGASTSTRLP